jgi:hypothetical protein
VLPPLLDNKPEPKYAERVNQYRYFPGGNHAAAEDDDSALDDRRGGAGMGLAEHCRWASWRESPESQPRASFAGRICVDPFPIEPPALSRFADPYDPDPPPPQSPQAQR